MESNQTPRQPDQDAHGDQPGVSVRACGTGQWANLDKKGVQAEWTQRGLGGKDQDAADEKITAELSAISRRLTIDWLSRLMPNLPTCRTLEIGCGWGRVFLGMKDRHPAMNYSGIDLTDNLIDLARARAVQMRVEQPYTLDVGDAENLAFDDQTFDFAYSCRVFQYLPQPIKGAREALRVLKPGGRLVVVLPNKLNPKRRHYHTRLYLPREVRNWFQEAGFVDLVTRFYGFMPVSRSEPMTWLDKSVEWCGLVPGVRALGALMLVSGVRPR